MNAPVSRQRYTLPSFALVLLAASGGCASASAVRLGEAVYEPRPLDHPVIVFDTRPTSRPHIKVGRVVGEGNEASFEAIVEVMRMRVRELGGDALVLLGGGLLAAGVDDCGTVQFDRSVQGLAIRWDPQP